MTVRRFILLSIVCTLIILLNGRCSKSGCDPNPPGNEAPAIITFAAANSIPVTAHPSGLFYQVIDSGSGVTPTLSSKIYITYIGKLLDGTVFDHKDLPNTAGLMLSGFIEGWRLGIPLIKKGGRIILIVPSALGYGCEPYKGLPGNSILYFDVQLVDIQ